LLIVSHTINLHNYKFFGHTWNNSFYNKEHRFASRHRHPNFDLKNAEFNGKLTPNWHDQYDNQTLHNMLTAAFGMSGLLVEDKKIVNDRWPAETLNPGLVTKFSKEHAANLKVPMVYSHMSYSKMRANSLKTRYELENEMQFDVVVSARFDVCYPPESKLDHLLQHHGAILPTAIYGSAHYFPNEYFLPNFDSVIYFGNSRIMNVVDGFSRLYVSGKFWEMLDENWTDCALKACGYEVNLYKWLTMKNILMKPINTQYSVFRKTAEHLKWPQEWQEIVNINGDLFQ